MNKKIKKILAIVCSMIFVLSLGTSYTNASESAAVETSYTDIAAYSAYDNMYRPVISWSVSSPTKSTSSRNTANPGDTLIITVYMLNKDNSRMSIEDRHTLQGELTFTLPYDGKTYTAYTAEDDFYDYYSRGCEIHLNQKYDACFKNDSDQTFLYVKNADYKYDTYGSEKVPDYSTLSFAVEIGDKIEADNIWFNACFTYTNPYTGEKDATSISACVNIKQ